MKKTNPVQLATARLASMSRTDRENGATPEQIEDARNDLLAARLDRAIEAALDPDPPYHPLRREDRVRFARRLTDG